MSGVPAGLDPEWYFLYDQVVEHLVRLRWFASSSDLAPLDAISEDLDHVAGLLAKRDLLVFATSLRNFAEATSSVPPMKKKFTTRLSEVSAEGPDLHRETEETITLHQALSRILHAKYITIIRNPLELLTWDEAAKALETPRPKRKSLEHPLVGLSTKKDGETLIQIDSLIDMSCKYLALVLKAYGRKSMLARVDRDGAGY